MAGIRSEYSSKNKDGLTVFNLPSNWTWSPTIHWEFDGSDALLRAAKQPGTIWTSTRVSRKHDPDLGTPTWEEAVRLAETGWSEGRNRLVQQTGVEAYQVAASARGWIYDYAGAHPDVPRFLGGDLDCMVDYQPDYLRFRPIVRIVVSPITFSDVSQSNIKNWGAALVSWIDELERSGRRVEITWLSCSQPSWVYDDEKLINRGGPRVAISFRLKDADQPVELDRLAFWIMHPAAQRRMQFAVKEQMNIEKWYKEDCGVPISDVKFMREVFGKDAMFFPIENGAATVEIGLNEMKKRAKEYLSSHESVALGA